jgi:hypothetical protein
MGDWGLTEFKSRLDNATYPHAFDQPGGQPPAGPPRPAPAPPAPMRPGQIAPITLLAGVKPRGGYLGPISLLPECVAQVEQYYLEKRAALVGKVARPLFRVGWLPCLAAAIMGVMLLNESRALNRSVATAAPARRLNPHAGQIGIINPSWVAHRTSHSNIEDDAFGFFDPASDNGIAVPPPDKYIYVPPAEAQEILAGLIKGGFVTAAGGPPNAIRDFAKLKSIGITTD